MRRLVSSHAEDVGGFVVEPGDEFDESAADEATVKRLEDEGKLAEVKAAPKSSGRAKSSEGE